MLKRRDLDRAFTKLHADRVRCKHHVRGFVTVGSGKSVPVFVSRGSGEIPKIVIDKISKSLGLKKQTFIELCKCKVSRKEFLELTG